MSDQAFYSALQTKLDTLQTEGLFKPERVIASRQGAEVVAADGRTLVKEEVTEQDIAEVVSKWTGVPVSSAMSPPYATSMVVRRRRVGSSGSTGSS